LTAQARQSDLTVELIGQREVERRPWRLQNLTLKGGPGARRQRWQQQGKGDNTEAPIHGYPAGRDSTMGCAMIHRLAVVYPTIRTSITS
jgi:hypothetical protein